MDVGSSVLIVGFPLGLPDTLDHLPVLRQSVIAAAFGRHLQGQAYFLTTAGTQRGTSGAALVMRDHHADADAELPWTLLGMESAR